MARPVPRKGRRLSKRLADADIAIIDRAARLRGCSNSKFMRVPVVQASEGVIMENRVIRMSPEGFAAFATMLDNPAKPVPEIVALLKRLAPWEAKAAAE